MLVVEDSDEEEEFEACEFEPHERLQHLSDKELASTIALVEKATPSH